MKVVLILLVSVAMVVAQKYYDSKYDDFNADELVSNTRLLKSYGNCFLGKGHCTAEGSDFKKILPEALSTSCGKCSPKQRQIIRTVVKGFQAKLPDHWTELVKKHDPEGKYRADFEKFLNSTN